MALQLNGSTGYLAHPARVANSFPFSIAIWVAGSTSVSNQVAVLQGQSNGDRYAMGWFTNFGENKIADYRNPGTGNQALKNTTPHLSPTTMRLMVLVYESTTSRKVYFGSNVESTNATSMTDDVSNHDKVMVGAYQVNSAASPSLFLTGDVAEVHFYSRALTDTDYDSMTTGTLPETLSNWIDGWTLQNYSGGGTYTSIGGSRTLTANGGVAASSLSHPYSRTPTGPTINTQPSNQTVTAPTTAVFTVAATASAGSLTYQWQRNPGGNTSFANVTTGTGGTTNSYTTAATSVSGGNANNTDTFRCVVTDSNGSINSNAATLTVNAPLGAFTNGSGGALSRNNGSAVVSVTLSWLALINDSTGAFAVTKTNVAVNGSGVFSTTDTALAAGTTYTAVWKESTGQRGHGTAVAT